MVYNSGCEKFMQGVLPLAFLATAFLPAARAQLMLPPVMAHPSKLSADRFLNDEDPAVARDAAGRTWVAWYSCRTASTKLPSEKIDLKAWEWPDDGKDVVVARWFDGKNWSDEQVVSSEPGVNWKPVIVPEEGGVRVLWTSLRAGEMGGLRAALEGRELGARVARVPG